MKFNRDLFYLFLLICMFKVAMDLREPRLAETPTLSVSALEIGDIETVKLDESDTLELNENAPLEELALVGAPAPHEHAEKSEPFNVHEVDESVIKQIELAQSQINTALTHINPTSLDATQLRSLQQRLVYLRVQYQHTSPAVALLGPLGTAAIVLKEGALEKELLHTVNKFGSILHTIVGGLFTPAKSVVESLEENHKLIEALTVS